jgi:hypothetical protein
MNEKITYLEKCLETNKKERETLITLLEEAALDYLKSRGITKGSVVSVEGKKGIFDSIKYGYGRFVPTVYKIKKDGTPHSTATLYCFTFSDMSASKID